MDFDIVEATTDDEFAEAGILGVRLVRFHHALDPGRFTLCEGGEAAYAETLKASITTLTSSIVLLARDRTDRRSLGYLYGQLQEAEFDATIGACGHLHELYVGDEARHRGVGKALLGAFLSRARIIGSRRIVVMVASANIAAQDLFSLGGFAPTMLEMICEFL